MSFHSHSRLTAISSNEFDRLERAEEDDEEAEEKAENPNESIDNKFVSLRASSESLIGIPPGFLARFRIQAGEVLRKRYQQVAKFIRIDFYNGLKSVFLVSGFTVINRRSVRSIASITHERVRHSSTYPLIIHPFSLFRWLWDVGMIIACAITLAVDPLLATFSSSEYTDYKSWRRSFTNSIIFFVDIFLNIRTGLVQPKTDIVTLDGRTVLVTYLTGWFCIDFISSLPTNEIFLALLDRGFFGRAEDTSLDWARICSITKFLLIFRLIRYLKRIEMGFRLNGLEVRLINLLIIMGMCLHWLACCHYLVADLANEDSLPLKKRNSWLTKMDLWESDAHEKYMNCVLRALSHLSLIGFGFEAPIEIEEIYLSIFNIVVGCVFIAQALGYVITMLMSLDVAERRFIEVTKQAGEYMRFKQIPKGLQSRVEAYFQHRFRRNYFSEDVILNSVSNVLQRDLLMHNCHTLVEEVPIFHGINRNVLQEIVSRLAFEVYLPNDVIIWDGTVGDCMYFIEHGTVSILAPEGQPICTLHDGDFFGEMSMVFNEPRVATVIANTFCDIYRLEKLDFIEVVLPYPDIYEAIVKVAEARAAHLDKANLYKHVRTSDGEQKENKNTS